MTPYGDIVWVNIGSGHTLVTWRHQAITWTKVDVSSVRPAGIAEDNFTETGLDICYNTVIENEIFKTLAHLRAKVSGNVVHLTPIFQVYRENSIIFTPNGTTVYVEGTSSKHHLLTGGFT